MQPPFSIGETLSVLRTDLREQRRSFRGFNYTEAEQVFRTDLRINPKNPWSLFGLWQTLAAQKRDSEALDVKNQFNLGWRDADITLTIDRL